CTGNDGRSSPGTSPAAAGRRARDRTAPAAWPAWPSRRRSRKFLPPDQARSRHLSAADDTPGVLEPGHVRIPVPGPQRAGQVAGVAFLVETELDRRRARGAHRSTPSSVTRWTSTRQGAGETSAYSSGSRPYERSAVVRQPRDPVNGTHACVIWTSRSRAAS